MHHPFTRRKSLEERLVEEAARLRDHAKSLPLGVVRDAAKRAARQAETAAHISDWLRSPGLRSPT